MHSHALKDGLSKTQQLSRPRDETVLPALR